MLQSWSMYQVFKIPQKGYNFIGLETQAIFARRVKPCSYKSNHSFDRWEGDSVNCKGKAV